MPCTAWRKMSSAMRNASKKLVPCSTHSINRSLGITMTVSTQPISSLSACSAWFMRRLPSKANGFVTTATVSAPSSLARFATTGAEPLPVPPPRPEVTNTISAPSRASRILSVSSSAALRPTSGFAPAPRPLVNFAPSWSLTGACESLSACASVLAAMNSTPSTLARIMRLTALHPPPPTPITFILAPSCGSSLNETRRFDSFGAMLPPGCRFPNLQCDLKFQFSDLRAHVCAPHANEVFTSPKSLPGQRKQPTRRYKSADRLPRREKPRRGYQTPLMLPQTCSSACRKSPSGALPQRGACAPRRERVQWPWNTRAGKLGRSFQRDLAASQRGPAD